MGLLQDFSSTYPGRRDVMSIMCSMQACKAQAGMCGHEKMMFGIAVLLAAGTGAYLFLG